MQISRIQNIVRNNFQYKNNSIKFNPINFKGQDTFEHTSSDDVVVSKRYCRGKKEFNPNLLLQQEERLFILNKGAYFPYGAHLEEYNAKGEIVRHTSFNTKTHLTI